MSFAKVRLGVAFNDADTVVHCRLLAFGVDLLPQVSTANGGNLCERVCFVRYSTTVCKSVATLVEQNAAMAIYDNFAIA